MLTSVLEYSIWTAAEKPLTYQNITSDARRVQDDHLVLCFFYTSIHAVLVRSGDEA